MMGRFLNMRFTALVHLRKNCCAKLLHLVLVCLFFTCYVSLLRYNKASANNFNLREKRRSADKHNSIFVNLKRNKHVQPEPKSKIRRFHSDRPANISKSNESPIRNDTIQAYIVEEHHEVLRYWFEEVDKGHIPKNGNTLVHIDGHSDMGPPTLVNAYPFFRYPHGLKDIAKMTQTNDVFIVSAIIAGLVRRVVWVWPWWDRESHDGMYTVQSLSVGWGHVPHPNRQEEMMKVFCLCMLNISSNRRECQYSPMDDSTQYGKQISADDCKIKKSILFEEIREDEAIDKLKAGKWLLENESVILDIDEDFYGCTYAISPLLTTGVSMSTIVALNRILNQLFCPQSGHDETAADKLLLTVINVFRNHSRCHNGAAGNKMLKRSTCANDTRLPLAEKTMISLLQAMPGKALCTSKVRVKLKLVKKLLNIFSNLRIKQLRSLQNVGFCLTTTPKSYHLLGLSKFQTCQGANTPNQTSVAIHNPTMGEISRRTKLLKQHLQLIKSQSGDPVGITICRSIRDGYTPRYHSKLIERNVVSSLQSAFKHLFINYDIDLLGGKRGWADRHKVSFM